jgi:hypothetical protein
MRNELKVMQSGAKITTKAHADHGQEIKWEIPL